MKIRIENPTPGGARFTSLARARLYERQGCAKLSADGKRLRFLESHHRKQSAELSAQEMANQEHRLSAGGYDSRETVLTLEEIARLPAVRPILLATIPKRTRKHSVRSGKVRVLMQNGIAVREAPVVAIDSAASAPKTAKTQQRAEGLKAA